MRRDCRTVTDKIWTKRKCGMMETMCPLPQVWVQSLYSVGVDAERAGDTQLAAAVADTLRRMQRVREGHRRRGGGLEGWLEGGGWGLESGMGAAACRVAGAGGSRPCRLRLGPGAPRGGPHMAKAGLRGPGLPPPGPHTVHAAFH